MSQLIGPARLKLLVAAVAATAFLASVSFCRQERIELPAGVDVALALSTTCAEQQTPDESVAAAAGATTSGFTPEGAPPPLFAEDAALPAAAPVWECESVEPAVPDTEGLSICDAASPDWPGWALCPATGSQYEPFASGFSSTTLPGGHAWAPVLPDCSTVSFCEPFVAGELPLVLAEPPFAEGVVPD